METRLSKTFIVTKSVKYKKHVTIKHFSDAKINNMKHYVKSTQEKKTCGNNFSFWYQWLTGNKNSEEITNEIEELANSIKASVNNIVV